MAMRDNGYAYADNVYNGYGERWEDDDFSPSRQSRPKRESSRLPDTLKNPNSYRSQRRKNAAFNKMAMYITIAIWVICIFVQVARYAQIAIYSKQISSVRNEIRELEKQKENYELRLSAREDRTRLRNEAYSMGCFVDADDAKTKVISLNREKPNGLKIIAANTEK